MYDVRFAIGCADVFADALFVRVRLCENILRPACRNISCIPKQSKKHFIACFLVCFDVVKIVCVLGHDDVRKFGEAVTVVESDGRFWILSSRRSNDIKKCLLS